MRKLSAAVSASVLLACLCIAPVRGDEACVKIDAHLVQLKAEAGAVLSDGAPALIGDLCRRAVGGDPDAQFEMADLFSKGWYAPRDFAEAHRWYSKAAAAGNQTADAIAARYLVSGSENAQDIQRGITRLRELAEAGNPRAMGLYGHLLRQDLPSSARSASIDFQKDNALGVDYIEKAAAAGDANSAYTMSFFSGQGERTEEANAWTMKAATGGVANAQYDVARMYRSGMFGDANEQEYGRLMLLAAVNGSRKAQDMLGAHYKNGGGGFAIDYQMSEFWFGRAKDLGSSEAERQLADRANWGVEPKRDVNISAEEVWIYGLAALLVLGIAMEVGEGGSSGAVGSVDATQMGRDAIDSVCPMMTSMEQALAGC